MNGNKVHSTYCNNSKHRLTLCSRNGCLNAGWVEGFLFLMWLFTNHTFSQPGLPVSWWSSDSSMEKCSEGKVIFLPCGPWPQAASSWSPSCQLLLLSPRMFHSTDLMQGGSLAGNITFLRTRGCNLSLLVISSHLHLLQGTVLCL